ncbi:HotDog domain-containing protein [Rhexocercosporidium sp. MPI-PUGE-AT-0058]|nr:HotDog domain-containing protein [Rhexocercosporidium sp. MPI-PUGE-AT-0058]
MSVAVQYMFRPRAVRFSPARVAPVARVNNLPLHLPLQQSRTLSTSKRLSDIQAIPSPPPASPVKKSLLRRTANVLLLSIVFTTLGFTMAAAPVIQAANGYLNPPTDEETLSMFEPTDAHAQEVEDFIKNHPLAVSLRKQSQYSESRPHMKVPEAQRSHSLTAGTLMGTGKVVVPPLVFSEHGGKSLVSIQYLGGDLCGHPGLVHGGMLATMLDEGLARCCFAALPNKVGMTANLNINYRAPAQAGSFVVLRATTTKVEGRKAWVEGHIETLVGEGEKPIKLAEASALFIEPRQAAQMARVYPVQ